MSDYQVVWRGIIHDSGGYGRAGREYVLALDRLGVDVKLEPIDAGTAPAVLPDDVCRRLGALSAKPYAEHKKRILIVHLQPTLFDPRAERHRYDFVIGCAAWETTRVPDSWLVYSNHFDAMIGFSAQSVKAFADSGITVPLYRVPHGAPVEVFGKPCEPTRIPPFDDCFKFLSVLRWDHRKAPEVLLRAFWEEFGAKENVLLILKTYPGEGASLRDRLALRDQIAVLRRSLGFNSTRAPVLVNVDALSDAQMVRLYHSADVFVLPTRGEAAGLPFLEAMSAGLPVIATGWGGKTDFLNDANAWLVDYTLAPTTASRPGGIAYFFDTLFSSDMLWAEPSVQHLRQVMRGVFEGRDTVRAKGAQAREDAQAMTWDRCAGQLRNALDELVRGRQ